MRGRAGQRAARSASPPPPAPACRPPPCRSSSVTTGITSRTLELVNTSSAANSRSIANASSTTSIPRAAAAASRVSRVTPARMPRSSAGRAQLLALREPHVRRRPLQHDPLGRQEHRIVRPAPVRLPLRRHVDRVAGRLHARQQPRRRAPGVRADRQLQRRQRHTTRRAAARARPAAPSPARTRRRPARASRPPVHTTRSTQPGAAAAATASIASGASRAGSGAGRPSTSADPTSRARCASSRNGTPVVDPHRLERRPAPQHPRIVRVQQRLLRVDDAAAEQRHRQRRVAGRGHRHRALD